MVRERGLLLRATPFSRLAEMADGSTEDVVVGTRVGTISVIVEAPGESTLKIVVQGFLKMPRLPGESVALDGFYKYADASVIDMTLDELCGYD